MKRKQCNTKLIDTINQYLNGQDVDHGFTTTIKDGIYIAYNQIIGILDIDNKVLKIDMHNLCNVDDGQKRKRHQNLLLKRALKEGFEVIKCLRLTLK